MVKAKLNDIVCICTRHTWTEVITMKTTSYDTFILAKAVKVNRKGIVERYIAEPNAYEEMITLNQQVMVIGDPVRQSAAKELFKILKGKKFDSPEAVREIILNHEQMTA